MHVIDHVTHEWLPHADREVFSRTGSAPSEASQS